VPRCCHGREEEYEAVQCVLRAYPGAHGVSFVLALALALPSMRTLSAVTSLSFDTELLATALGTVMHLTLLATCCPTCSSKTFLPHLPAHVSRTPRCPTLSACPLLHAMCLPQVCHASPCSTAMWVCPQGLNMTTTSTLAGTPELPRRSL
jgi:hypothetical protein